MQNYLQQILTESNTIIIPGFGALTITSTKTGDIYFMPFLKHDDGQLAKYIAKVETIEPVRRMLATSSLRPHTLVAQGLIH